MKKKQNMEEILRRQKEALKENGKIHTQTDTQPEKTEPQEKKEKSTPTASVRKTANIKDTARTFTDKASEFTKNKTSQIKDKVSEVVNEKMKTENQNGEPKQHPDEEKSNEQKEAGTPQKTKLDLSGNKVNKMDKVVDFVRGGKLFTLAGIILAVLLAAYICGVFISLVSPKEKATISFLKAVGISFTSLQFYKLLVILIIVAALIYLVTRGLKGKTKEELNFNESSILGSSGYITDDEKELLLERKMKIEDMSGLIFGRDPDSKEYIGLPEDSPLNRNIAVCGSQGSKKSWGYVRNNLAQLIKLGSSALITDPKGEMYRDMSRAFLDAGYIVKQFNLKDMYSSDSWNCLGDVNTNNIDSFCKTFIMNTVSKEFDNFYDNLDILLLKSLCLYVKYEDKDIEDDDRTLGKAYMMLLENTEQELDNKFLSLSRRSLARQTYMSWMKGDNAKKNSLVSLSGRLQIFSKPVVQKITGISDIDLTLPAKKKCAYFVIFDDQNDTYESLSSIFINSLIETLVGDADSKDSGKLDIPIHFMFDEFPSVGEIPNWKRKLATIRSRGLGVTMIFQNIPQLMNRYPDNVWVELLGGCDMQILLGANEDVTAEYFSKKTGEATVIASTERRTHNTINPLDYDALFKHATTESYQRRYVMTADEVIRLRENDQALLFVGGSRPYLMNKVPFSDNPLYPVQPYHPRKNVPIWMLKEKEKTNFRTEYGGIYNLGIVEDMPQYFRKLLDYWREEDLSGMSNSFDDNTLPAPYSVIYDSLDMIKRLNKRQGTKLMEIIKQLMESKDNEFATYSVPEDLYSNEDLKNEDEEKQSETDQDIKNKKQPNQQNVVNVDGKQVDADTGEVLDDQPSVNGAQSDIQAAGTVKPQKAVNAGNEQTVITASGRTASYNAKDNQSAGTRAPVKKLKFNVTERKE